MEAKFRPIPLSIIDFLAVLVPGFVWLLLLVTAAIVLTGDQDVATPKSAWFEITKSSDRHDSWLRLAATLAAAAVLGYTVKPKAMRMASAVSPLFYKLHYKLGGHPHSTLQYPYRVLHENDQFYKALVAMLDRLFGCQTVKLPGNQPFTSAKRFLRVIAPSLWEESEHMEAEVRLTGALLLAAVFSVLLSITELVRESCWRAGASANTVLWFALSLVGTVLLGEGFNYMRLREVEYTYINALLAAAMRESGLLLPPEAPSDE